MILPPILTASFPSPPGPHAVGYTFLTHPPFSPFFHPSPALKSTGRPAFRIEEIGYCLFYPTLTGGKEGKGWVNWVPEPFWGVIKGYERFLGGKGGMSWLVKPLGYIAGRLQVWLKFSSTLCPSLIIAHTDASVSSSTSQPNRQTISPPHLLSRPRGHPSHLQPVLCSSRFRGLCCACCRAQGWKWSGRGSSAKEKQGVEGVVLYRRG